MHAEEKANWEKKAIFYCLLYSSLLFFFLFFIYLFFFILCLIEIKLNPPHVIVHYPNNRHYKGSFKGIALAPSFPLMMSIKGLSFDTKFWWLWALSEPTKSEWKRYLHFLGLGLDLSKMGDSTHVLKWWRRVWFSFTSFSTHLKRLLPHHRVSVFTAPGQTEQSSCDIISSSFCDLLHLSLFYVCVLCVERERERRENILLYSTLDQLIDWYIKGTLIWLPISLLKEVTDFSVSSFLIKKRRKKFLNVAIMFLYIQSQDPLARETSSKRKEFSATNTE